MFSMANCCTAGDTGSAQKVPARSELMSKAAMSRVLAGSVITAFKKVEPALNKVMPYLSMVAAKRPA